MSLDHNLQEESPGVFLSLSAQSAPLSPFISREAEASVREFVKQKKRDLAICLSLKPPSQSQGTVRQHAVACLQPSVWEGLSGPGQHVLAHGKEPKQHIYPCIEEPQDTEAHTLACVQQNPNRGQCGVFYVKEPQNEHTTVEGSAQHMLAHAQGFQPSQTSEQRAPQYLTGVQEKHSTPPCPKAAGQYILAYAQVPHSSGQHTACLLKESVDKHKTEASSEKTSEELKPYEHETVSQKPSISIEEQEGAPQKSLLEHQKTSNLQEFSQQQSTTNGLLEQQKGSAFVGFAFQPNSSSLRWILQQQQIGDVFQLNSGSLQGQQKYSFVEPLEKQKLPPSKHEEEPLSQQKGHDAHGPHSSSLELDQRSLPPHEWLLCKGPLAKQTAALYRDDQRFSFSPHQVKTLTSPQGPSKKHDLEESYLKEHSDQQKREPFHKFSPRPAPRPATMSIRFNEDGVFPGQEHPTPPQSLQGLFASPEEVYPTPLATHMAVLADERLFVETLQSLNAALGLKVRVSKIGEIALNVHKLYKEVTCRGGVEMVTKNKKWNEVTREFNFPVSVTVLKSCYTDVLYHYEQVYFLRACGKVAIPASYVTHCEQETASIWKQDLDAVESEQSTTIGIINTAQVLGVDPASSVGAMVTGAIHGKFENGYLVTVTVGTRKLSGVLYHVASTNTLPQNACVQVMMPDVGSELKPTALAPRVGRKRKNTRVYRKDPNAPRQNRTGYNFFFAEQRAKLKTMQPDKDRAISKKIGELWNRLSENEKTPYQEKGVKDKERYVREMNEYKEKVQLPSPNYSKVVLSHIPSMHTPGSAYDCMQPQLFSTCTSTVSPQLPFRAQRPFAEASSHSASLDNDTWSLDRNPCVEAGPDTSADVVVSNTDFRTITAQLPSACTVKALNDSQHGPVPLSNATLSADKKSSVGTGPESSTNVNRENFGLVLSMLDTPMVEDTSDASIVNDMAYADSEDPKKADNLSQPKQRKSSSETVAQRRVHLTAVEE